MDSRKKLKPPLKPRKIPHIKPSKYEYFGAYQANKIYWTKFTQDLENKVKNPFGEHSINEIREMLSNKTFDKKLTNETSHVRNKSTGTLESHVRNSLSHSASGKKGWMDFYNISLQHVAPVQQTHNSEKHECHKEVFISRRKTLLVKRELESDTEVEVSPRKVPGDHGAVENPHYDFLTLPERDAVTWPSRYLQPEREDEKTLEKRADDLTNKIANEFCEYMIQLGGHKTLELFTPAAIKDLFAVGFNKEAARSLTVDPKEIPSVFDHIAAASHFTQNSRSAALNREIKKDIKAENRPAKIFGFGTRIPHKHIWVPPNNNTKNVWCTSKNIPEDIVTLKTVWEGITNLKSVNEYCRWMINQPVEYRRPPYLQGLGMFDKEFLNVQCPEDKHFPRPSR